jgi:hypothetical protein
MTAPRRRLLIVVKSSRRTSRTRAGPPLRCPRVRIQAADEHARRLDDVAGERAGDLIPANKALHVARPQGSVVRRSEVSSGASLQPTPPTTIAVAGAVIITAERSATFADLGCRLDSCRERGRSETRCSPRGRTSRPAAADGATGSMAPRKRPPLSGVAMRASLSQPAKRIRPRLQG